MENSQNEAISVSVYREFKRVTPVSSRFYELRIWREGGVIRFLAEWGPQGYSTQREYNREFNEYPGELFERFSKRALARGYVLVFEESEPLERLYQDRADRSKE